MNTKINVLIADDNIHFTGILKDYLKNQDDINIVGIANDGLNAYNMILEKNPQVVILDIIMPKLDGLGILEKIKNSQMEEKPLIIILSAVGQESITQKALNLGAEYYIVKPFNFEILVSRIRQIKNQFSSVISSKSISPTHSSILSSNQTTSLELEVTNIMHRIGIPAHIRGYQFLRDSLLIAINNIEIVNSITKKLYPLIAEKYSTTPNRVERAIRNAIEVTWSRGDVKTLNKIFGYTINADKGKPTNSEFIAMIADKLRLQMKIN